MRSRVAAFAVGLLAGAALVLLVGFLDERADRSVAERLEAALHCDDGPGEQTAAIAHRVAGYSTWAVTHATRLYGIGCDAGPATIYIQFSPYRSTLERALATMKGFGPLCIVDDGFFEGRVLAPVKLEDLCSEVGGEVRAV